MSDEYVVERIVDKKIDKHGRTMYFIKWKDWDESTNTWEPEAHLENASKLLAEFNANWKKKEEAKTNNSGFVKPLKTSQSGVVKPTSKKNKKTSSLRENSDANDKKASDFTLPEHCGFDKGYVAEKIVGATDSGGAIKFLVKWKDKNDDVELVTNERARKHCPQLVIKFYEQNIQWDEN